MPTKILPRILDVATDGKTPVLQIRWDSGTVSRVDVSALVDTFRVYMPLRDNPHLFAQMTVGEHGTDIVWPGDIDISADTLWRLAQEQASATMSADAFRNWRERKALTLDAAAAALSLSRRMVAYYEQGDRPLPRVVALAARGLDSKV